MFLRFDSVSPPEFSGLHGLLSAPTILTEEAEKIVQLISALLSPSDSDHSPRRPRRRLQSPNLTLDHEMLHFRTADFFIVVDGFCQPRS